MVLKRHGLSSSAIKRAKRVEGGILVNDAPAHTDRRVCTGDVLSVTLQDTQIPPRAAANAPLPHILYEDADVLIVEKPCGMNVHPAHELTSLEDAVLALYAARGESHLYRPVNRLDRLTSGLMAVAKHAHAHHALIRQMEAGSFTRGYVAVLEGVLQPEQGVIDAPIGLKDGQNLLRCVREDGKRAVTHYRTLAAAPDASCSLVAFRLETGRTHQIRVHAAWKGHPLLGDFLYGTEREGTPFLLHSCILQFCPLNGDPPVTLFCPPPPLFTQKAAQVGLSLATCTMEEICKPF